MNSWLLMYLIGFFLCFTLIVIANKDVKVKTWKLKAIGKTILFCFSSWIGIYVIAIKAIVD